MAQKLDKIEKIIAVGGMEGGTAYTEVGTVSQRMHGRQMVTLSRHQTQELTVGSEGQRKQRLIGTEVNQWQGVR